MALALDIFDLDTHERASIPVPVLAHAVVGNPARRERVVLFGDKPGTRSCEVDLVERKVTRVFSARPNSYFYGHGLYSKDGATLFSVEYDFESGEGVCVARDGATFQELGVLPTYGIGPHEAVLTDDGAVMIAANGGLGINPHEATGELSEADAEAMRPELTFVELATGKLLERLALPNKFFSVRHLAAVDASTVAVGLKTFVRRDGTRAIGLRLGGGALQSFDDPPDLDLKGNTLSVCVDPRRRVAGFTSPEAGLVTFWSLDDGRFLTALSVAKAEGLTMTPDGERFLVTSRPGLLWFVDAGDLSVVGEPIAGVGLGYKHSLTWCH